MTAALALARDGATVTVLEARDGPSDHGAGIQITPNGARALGSLGVAPMLDAVGIAARAVVPVDALSGRRIARFDLSAQSPPYRFVDRRDLVAGLTAACAAAGVDIRHGARVTGAEASGIVHLGDGAIRADLVVGADGIRSVLRPVCGNPGAAIFSGQVAWRAVIDAPGHPPEARIWMAPGRHVVTYPLTDGRLNLVAVQERDAWAEEGWHHADDPETLRAAFADCCAELRDILAAVTTPRLWGLFRHPVAARWHAGRVALLGDAAHPTLPFLAQGANLAIEDAVVLARIVGQGRGLAAYEAARRPRVVRAIAAADANARNYHLSGLRRRVAHLGLSAIGRAAPGAFLSRLSWLYDHDVTAD